MKRFSKPVLGALDASGILGVRSGTEHKFTGVWPIVMNGRLFVRSWNNKPTGWYRAFVDEPNGAIQMRNGRELRVRARPVKSAKLIEAMDDAYAEKFNTPASRKWVVGFRRPKRRAATIELTPR